MKKNLLFFFIPGTLAVIIFAALGGVYLLNRPLGEPLEIIAPPATTIQVVAQPEVQPADQAKKTCANTGSMNVFVLGQASPMDAGHYGIDAIRLVRVDFDNGSVSVLALPSDLWVDAAALENPIIEKLSLNDIYQNAYENANSNNLDVLTRKATQVLAQTIVDNFGFVPDHYVTMQGESFIELVDMVGIEVDVPYDILNVPEGWSIFQAGLQTMNGKQALDYVRILTPGELYSNIWDRFDRQNQVLLALLDSVLKPENWEKVPETAKLARKMVVTDLSVKQANSLACMLEESRDQIELIQITQEMVSLNEQGHMVLDTQTSQILIAEMENK